MKLSVYNQLLILVCVTLVSATRLQDDIITPCGVCTCNMRQSSADCSDRQLSNIPADLPANITDINLARNRIETADEDQPSLCQQYPDLKTVSLAWNGIRTLSSLLRGCHRVDKLDLTGNILELVQPTELADVHSLQTLTALEVQALDASIFHKMKRLETLHLTFHGLTVQPGVFRELSSLRWLTLTLEKALRLPQRLFVFTGGNVLKQLTLKGSKVKEIPDDLFSELLNLKELHLDLPHVLQLKMNTNNKHQYLQVLEVSNVRSVAEDLLSGLQFLQVVIFRGISHLAGANLFQAATAVKELEIVKCSLTQLPAGWLDNMLALETLNLSEDRLEKLSPSDFKRLTSLKHLVLSKNKIQDLPPGVFSSLKSTLRQLLLDDNQLRQLPPETFSDMSMLEVLDLRRNMIENITASSLRDLPRLRLLQLSGNYINSLDHVLFNSLPSLEELDLSENIISQFPETLLASNLSRLLFSANNLRHLPGERMCRMGSLLNLVVDDNPVFCDCSVRLLPKCLPDLLLSGTCSAPADEIGRNLEELTECATTSTSLTALSTLFSPTSSQAAFHSLVAFSLEPTPATETASDTWSPQLVATTFTWDSIVLSSRQALTVPIMSSSGIEMTASSNLFPVQTSMLAQPIILVTSALLTSSEDIFLQPSLVASDSPTPTLISSSKNLLSGPSLWLPASPAAPVMTSLMPGLMTSPYMRTGENSQALFPATVDSSRVALPAAGLTRSQEPKEDSLDYDTFTGFEIVRPLVANGVLERKKQLPVTSDKDKLLTTKQTQSPVVSPVSTRPHSSVAGTQPDSASSLNKDRAATDNLPLRQDNDTEALPPKIAHVKTQPDPEEINDALSVAGEITVAMFFSLVVLLSVMSGILLYRKYFHVGSYNTGSSPQQFVQMQTVEVDQGTIPAARQAATTVPAAYHTKPLPA